jgi:putative transposase
VLLAGQLRRWAQALVFVQPATVFRWHRQGFRLFWRRKSTARAATARLSPKTFALIRRIGAENRLWGADRIRGEHLKLDVRVSKRTIQKHMRSARPRRPSGQRWSAFVRNHAGGIWAGDFLQLTDLWFRPLDAFLVIALGSRRVAHVGVTRQPTDAWAVPRPRQ